MQQAIINPDESLWLVIDKIRVPNILQQLQQQGFDGNITELFAGSAFDYMLAQSPILVPIKQHSALLSWWQSQPIFNSSSVLFSAPVDIDDATLVAHLQQLLIVHIQGRPILLRYYAGEFWQSLAPHISAEDIDVLLGPFTHLYWLDKQLQRHDLSHTATSTLPSSPYVLQSPIFSTWLSL